MVSCKVGWWGAHSYSVRGQAVEAVVDDVGFGILREEQSQRCWKDEAEVLGWDVHDRLEHYIGREARQHLVVGYILAH